MNKVHSYSPLTDLLEKIIDNRGKTVPTERNGIPLIATNCIKHKSIYPTFENVRYVSQGIYDTWFRAHLEPHDILFVNKGTPGRSCLVPDPVTFCAAQDMIGLRCDKNKISYKYLFAVLRSDYIKQTVENFHVGLVIPHFKKHDLHNILIPRRDNYAEEDRIGSLYIGLSEKIEHNNKVSKQLEAMARMIFDYWFVQFDFPNRQGKPYKSSGGEMVYNPELKRSIPADWRDGKLSDIAHIIMGQSPPGSSYNESGEGIVFFQGCTDFGERYPVVRQYTTKPTRYASRGDILLSVRAPVGELNLAREDCCIGRGLSALRSKDGSAGYLFEVMKNFKQVFERRNGEGTTFGAITKDDLHSLKVIRPSHDILAMYDKVVSPMFEQQNIVATENLLLVEARDWLLPMLINGQVMVNTKAAAT